MKKIHKIKKIEHIKLLSDPLKLRLIQAFSESPKTAKQVSAELGENLTKLYRHVDALYSAGLLEITNEQQKRGTTERTFQSIAERFEADYSLFSDDKSREGEDAIRAALRAGEQEILESILNFDSDNADGLEPIMVRLRVKASQTRLDELREILVQWIDSVQDEEQNAADDEIEAGALIAFYAISESS